MCSRAVPGASLRDSLSSGRPSPRGDQGAAGSSSLSAQQPHLKGHLAGIPG